jgi:hypothetical protein
MLAQKLAYLYFGIFVLRLAHRSFRYDVLQAYTKRTRYTGLRRRQLVSDSMDGMQIEMRKSDRLACKMLANTDHALGWYL